MSQPRSVVQIHYHCRRGGVTTAMASYADMFAGHFGIAPSSNLVVASRKGSVFPKGTAVLKALSECDYRPFGDLKSFQNLRSVLTGTIKRILEDPSLPRPVCVVGHNLTLGKNLALSAAFSDLSSCSAFHKDAIRFYSVMHDLAEQGRFDLLEQIALAEKQGVEIRKSLYPLNKYVTYVAPGDRTARLLRRYRFACRCLPNGVAIGEGEGVLGGKERAAIAKAIDRLAREDGVGEIGQCPVCFYPVRVIPRKNVCEAILAVVALTGRALLVGGVGPRGSDRRFFNTLKGLCSRYRLPVVLDVDRIGSMLPSDFTKGRDLFALLQWYSDTCVTTSVAEGFGYGLYEPWLRGIPVVGRLPSGVRTSVRSLRHLYRQFPIPADWIDIPALANRYSFLLHNGLGRKAGKSNVKQTMLVRSNKVDFGLLGQTEQLEILERVLAESKGYEMSRLSISRAALTEQFSLFNRSKGVIVPAAAAEICDRFGPRAVGREFVRCFGRKATSQSGRGDYRALADYFSTPALTPILLTRAS